MDPSNGYEAVSEQFLACRGDSATRSIAISVKEVQRWAKGLPRTSSVIDLACGPGYLLRYYWSKKDFKSSEWMQHHR